MMYECICGAQFFEPAWLYDEELRNFQYRCPKCGGWEFEKVERESEDEEI